MSNIGYATLQVIPSMRGVDAALKSQLSGPAAAVGADAGTQAGKGFGAGLGTALKAVGGFVLVQQATQFFKGAFSEAQESNKVAAQTDAVLKSTGKSAHVTAGEVGGLADSLSKKASVDDEVIQKGENMLLTFRNIRNESGKGNDIFTQASKVSLDMAAAFSKANGTELDLQGTSIRLGKALNDPIQGITALRRVGVTFTDQQKEQIRTLVENGDKLGAQKLILQELNKEFGGSAAAQATAADKAKVAWGNLQEAIGKALIPVIAKLGEVLTPVLEFLANNRPVLYAIALVVGGALTAAFVAWAASLFAAGGALAFLLSPITLIVLAIGAIVAAVILVWTHWDQIWTWIKDHPAYAVIISILAAPVAAFVLIVGGLKTLWENWDSIWGWIKGAVSDAWNFISPIFDAVKGGLSAVGDAVNTLRDVWGGAWGSMKTIVEYFKGFISGVANGIIDPIKAVWNTIAGAINDIDIDIDGISVFGVEIVPDIHFHPHVPKLHSGGVFHAPAGQTEGLALLRDGERVLTPEQQGAGRGDRPIFGDVTIQYHGPLDDPLKRAREISQDLRVATVLAGMS